MIKNNPHQLQKRIRSKDLRRILKDQLVVIVIKTLSFLNKQKSLFKIVLINIMKKLRKRDWQLGGE